MNPVLVRALRTEAFPAPPNRIRAPIPTPRPTKVLGRINRQEFSTCGGAGVWRCLQSKLLFLETGAAQHGPALRGLEWNRGFGPTIRTGCPCFGADPRVTAGAFGLALLTPLRVVFELLIVEEELLARCEDEIGAAVYTLQYAILEFHGRLPNRETTPIRPQRSEHCRSGSPSLCAANKGPGPHLIERQ